MITIDGSFGEGGGQVLRTSLSLSALTGQAVRLYNIRAGRPRPGLQAQHLTSVRAAAAICDAQVEGDALNSPSLVFRPTRLPRAGDYVFDVTEARRGGSAGATTLVLQTVLLPLAIAPDGGESRVTLRGGTHAPFSPPFPYLRHIYLPTLWEMGVRAEAELVHYGWYPAGGGEITVKIRANNISPIILTERGELRKVWGAAAVSNLPSHIAQRMANRAVNVLKDKGITAHIEAEHVEATGPGAGIFIFAEYEHSRAGFTAYGRKGLPSEQVAGMASHDLAAHHQSNAATDLHLADQLVLPAALAAVRGQSHWTTCRITQHLLTNIEVVRRFLDVKIDLAGNEGEPGQVVIG